MKWQWLVLVVLTAVFSFGGSFTCSSNDDDRSDVIVTTP
jgi:hypothetical protein